MTRMTGLLALALVALVAGCGQEDSRQNAAPEISYDFSAILDGTNTIARGDEEAAPAPALDPKIAKEAAEKIDKLTQAYYDSVKSLIEAAKAPEETDEQKKAKEESVKAKVAAVKAAVSPIVDALKPVATGLKVPENAGVAVAMGPNAIQLVYVVDKKPVLVIALALTVEDDKVTGFQMVAAVPKTEDAKEE